MACLNLSSPIPYPLSLDLPVSLRVLRAKKSLALALDLLRELRVSVRNLSFDLLRKLRASVRNKNGLGLRWRISLVAALVIGIFALATVTVLERAFRDSAETTLMARLEAQLFWLMGYVELQSPTHLRFPQHLPDARLEVPRSGLYARVLDAQDSVLWQSPSTLGWRTPDWQDGDFFIQQMTVQWEWQGQLFPLTFEIMEDTALYQAQIESYRRHLGLALGVLTVLLILVQALALGWWGLRPLRQVRADLEALRQGTQGRLGGRYPQEIQELTQSINALLDFEHQRLQRQRHALADLAHSLKTPLAALRLDLSGAAVDRHALGQQVERMQDMIQHELNRAQRLGPAPFQPPLALAPLILRTCSALRRLAEQRGIQLHTALQDDCVLRMETGAVFEVLGNLLDNALRHAREQVWVRLHCEAQALVMMVDDDGPGIPAERRQAVLARGLRLDHHPEGQGLGLHLVYSLVQDHGGALDITQAPDLGGARVILRFPEGM